MSHAYNATITVESQGDEQIPAAFTWRGERYRVLHVNEPWHLQDRWWDAETESNRYYFRVIAKVPGHQNDIIADLYHDRAQGCWVLERVLD
jgi:hypothetical protein